MEANSIEAARQAVVGCGSVWSCVSKLHVVPGSAAESPAMMLFRKEAGKPGLAKCGVRSEMCLVGV